MKYNWQQKNWPDFLYDLSGIEDELFSFAGETGHITALLGTLPAELQIESILDTMVAEAIKTSEIEGEYLNRQDVVSSIRNKLGLSKNTAAAKDQKSKGAGELMVEVRNSYAQPLSKEILFAWHKLLMQGSEGVKSGAWRKHKEPMQVISGTFGKQKVLFEAPPSEMVPSEMARFIQWFNATAPGGKSELKKAPVRAAIAHLYFESIHPFEDGNGRIGRAIAEKALSQTLAQPVLLSLSRTIEANKKAYYAALNKGSFSNEITGWIKIFCHHPASGSGASK